MFILLYLWWVKVDSYCVKVEVGFEFKFWLWRVGVYKYGVFGFVLLISFRRKGSVLKGLYVFMVNFLFVGVWEVYGSLLDDFFGNSFRLWMFGVVCDNKFYMILICLWIFYVMDLCSR